MAGKPSELSSEARRMNGSRVGEQEMSKQMDDAVEAHKNSLRCFFAGLGLKKNAMSRVREKLVRKILEGVKENFLDLE